MLDQVDIELRWRGQRGGAGDSGEVGIAQLQLDGSRVKVVLAQAAAYLFRQVRQGCLQLLLVLCVHVEGVFVAD